MISTTAVAVVVLCFAVGVAVVALRHRSPAFIDGFLIVVAVVALVIQLSTVTHTDTESYANPVPAPTLLVPTPPPHPPPSASLAPLVSAVPKVPAVPTPVVGEDWDEDVGGMGPSMTVYVSSFKRASYAEGSGKTWRNVAPNSAIASSQCQADGTVRDVNFYFKTTPTFSRRDGMQLGANVITGPYSHQLGLNADQAMSVVVYATFTSAGPAAGHGGQVSLFKVPANTPGGNGLALTMSNVGTTGGLVSASLSLAVGSAPPLAMKSVMFSPGHKYALVIVKSYGRVSVVMTDVDAGAFAKTVLLETNLAAQESVILSNVDMTINAAGNWNGNLLAFAMYNRALTDLDVANLYAHYKDADRAFDPSYQALQTKLNEAATMRKCPYDEVTCSACGAVGDWTSQAAIVSAGDICLRQIDRFCSANPQHPQCSCWSTNHPAYAGTCKAYRSVFSGASSCPPVPPPAPKPDPPPPPPPPPQGIQVPQSDEAIGKILDAVEARRLRQRHMTRQMRKADTDSDSDSDSDSEKKKKKGAKKEGTGFWHSLFSS